ncbi:PP2C family protein-serine/threonine phosphatase [Pilimelia columellifera]|uniref:Serine/threonine phosphatase PstP n=1 Tax=Pilimelia columellifera subsp. columellifera TaxID=706583 RepID=A0ABN3N111_9ACTN
MSLTMRYAARSDRGLIRDGNQDSVYAGPRLLAVADGMGGMAAGDVASNIVIAAMAPLDEDVPGEALVDALRGAIDTANIQLRETVAANPQLEGMGTTLTAMLFSGSRIGLAHIGDSRAYLLRDDDFAQVTKDDTYVQMLVDEGRISPEEAGSHPQRSLLTRALDGRDVEPEYSVHQVLSGDRYMICSDGLSGVVSAETIADTLAQYPDPDECVERLVQLALRGGGPDNITVIVADATDQDIVESTPVVGGAAATDRGMATAADISTPAARASALTQPRPAAPEAAAADSGADVDPPRRSGGRPVLATVLVLGLLGGGLWGGWSWAQSQYYVGTTERGQVAVFKGVPADIGGWRLSSVHETSDTSIEELTSVAQDQVRGGIATDNRREAVDIMRRLISEEPGNPNRKPPCEPTASASPTEVLKPAPSTSPLAPTVGGSGARPPAGATPSATPDGPSDSPATVSPGPPGEPADCLESK